ncbi:hypothetical protein D3C72_1686010 [compost metagenome]
MVRAGLQAGVRLLLVADGGPDLGAEGARELDGGQADAAGAAVDQEFLAGGQTRAVEYVGPDGEVVLGNGGGGQQVQAARHRQAMAFVGQAVLRVSAARRQRADLVAGLPGTDLGADGHDGARHFQAQVGRGAEWWRVGARALQHVGTVDARIGDLDQYLPPLGRLHVALRDAHAVGRAALAVIDECAA